MKISATTSIEEIGALVCEALKAEGIDTILSGGAVVSIYSDNQYESFDLDFILPGLGKSVDGAMKKLGFSKERGRHYVHPATKYFVEFPGNTLAIGDSLDSEVVERKTKAGTLKLLSPTDCVKDRLAAYYHWNDRQGLNQAVMVASQHPVSLRRIQSWSKSEGFADKFEEFKRSIRDYKRDKGRL